MKKAIFFFCSVFLINSGSAQNSGKCATMDVLHEHKKDPAIAAGYAHAEQMARSWLANPANRQAALKKQGAIITIPVVVHVVYKNAAQNIPDTQIVRQVQILNECFRLQNPNFQGIRPIFDSLGADIEVEFCLAATDPQGNPTTGIVRKSAPSNASFDPLFNFDKVKSSATNGDDAWPHDKYLNIWTCDMSIFGTVVVLGYATFPGGPANVDGVVIQSQYFGLGTAPSPNNLGRTTVHEVGHWLGMRHIWADDDTQSGVHCDSSDFVDDTPNASAKSQSDCNLTMNSCANEAPYWGTIDPPDMVENYMDYSADACMALFTLGQKARMYSFFNTDSARFAIQTSPAGCSAVGIKDQYAYFSDHVFVYPNPASDVLHLNFTQLTLADLAYEIYDQTGQLVKTSKELTFQNTIPLFELSNGLYLVKVLNSQAQAVKKIAIQR